MGKCSRHFLFLPASDSSKWILFYSPYRIHKPTKSRKTTYGTLQTFTNLNPISNSLSLLSALAISTSRSRRSPLRADLADSSLLWLWLSSHPHTLHVGIRKTNKLWTQWSMEYFRFCELDTLKGEKSSSSVMDIITLSCKAIWGFRYAKISKYQIMSIKTGGKTWSNIHSVIHRAKRKHSHPLSDLIK